MLFCQFVAEWKGSHYNNRELKMDFFFVKDYRNNYRFFSSVPNPQIQANFSKWRKKWEQAKKRLMLLPPRILNQELAFERALKTKDSVTKIYFSGDQKQSRVRKKFTFFLQKQRSKHLFLLVVEGLLLPISGIMALLPGPNVFFYVLFLIMFIQWRALRGIKVLINKNHDFISSSLLKEWEEAVESSDLERIQAAIQNIEKEIPVDKVKKILYK